MNKFKVGDKVKEIGSNEIKEIDLVSSFDDGTIVYVLKFDDSEMYYEDELELYKTPHQELLDLGWVALNKANGVLTYLLNVDGSLHPEIIELSLEGKRYYTTLRIIDLQLAKLLVRYLEELEWQKIYYLMNIEG